MTSLLLDRTLWDLCLDAHGDIAVASEPYAVAQDVACALRTFKGDCWYDTTLGIPYFADILGQSVPLQVLKQTFIDAARSAAGVVTAQCYIQGLTDRQLRGQVVTTSVDGATAVTGIG